MLGIGAVLFLLGAVLSVATGFNLPAVYIALIGAILLAAGFLVGPRYRAEITSPHDGYESTGETFVDPTSRRTIEVWQHPMTGHRVYVRRS